MYTMTIRAAPMGRAGNGYWRVTVRPMVRQRKNVPMNSVRYRGMSLPPGRWNVEDVEDVEGVKMSETAGGGLERL
jgi:hypothetical protein